MALEPGTRLGHYEVLSSLGAGGMGEVYRARDTKLGREVAIKVLPEGFSGEPERMARFEREAKVLASLNHNNIATLYGFESEGDVQFLVMEVVKGETLAERIKRGAIPVEEALPLFLQIAEGLEAAHEKGIVHRDLKPANIKVTDDGQVKILDFGLAKAMAPPGVSQTDPSESPTITAAGYDRTRQGQILGTAAYMSPEQARGKPVDVRADVWAFGCVLYETLTGRRTFEEEDVSLTLSAVLQQEPAWNELPEGLPPSMATFLRRCLEKDPRQRVHAIADVRLALEGAFDLTGISPNESPWIRRWQRPVPLALAGLALLLVGGLVGWSVIRSPRVPPRIERYGLTLSDGEELAAPVGFHIVAFAPDGDFFVYNTQGDYRLWLRPLDQLQATPIAGAGLEPFVSSDSQWIGFWSDGQLKKVAASGGAAVALGEVLSVPFGATWGADDVILFGQGPDGIWRVPGGGGTPERIIPVESGESAQGPQALPGGEWVLFTLRPSGTTSWDAASIVLASLVDGERRVLVEGAHDGRYLPTGHLVYAFRGVLFAVKFDIDALQTVGGAVPMIEGIWTADAIGNPGAAQVSISTDGSLLYIPKPEADGAARTLAWVTLEGREEAVPVPARPYVGLSLSPDGSRAAVGIEGENPDVWVAELDRGTLTRITSDPARDEKPIWSPDGQSLVFASYRDGPVALFRKAADGTGPVERLVTFDSDVTFLSPVAWSPDGQTLALEVGTTRRFGSGLVSFDRAGTSPPLVETGPQGHFGAVSPDSRWYAYDSTETGPLEVYIQRFPERGQRQLASTRGGMDPRWSPDGRTLFYLKILPRDDLFERPRLAMARVPLKSDGTTLTLGTPEELWEFSYFNWHGLGPRYALSPDGLRFLVITQDAETNASSGPEIVVVRNWFEELNERLPTN